MLNFVVQTARDAGRILAERIGRRLEISNKGDIDLVTESDLASERLIIDRIKSHYPRHAILAEESGEALVHTRIIMTPRSAKTLLQMLQEMVAKYESTIGPVPERNA